MSLAFTKDFTATSTSTMILGRDANRLELTIFNLSSTEYLFIGFGTELTKFDNHNSMPLAPGEAYDASVAPLNAVFLMTNGPSVDTVVYWASKSPGYVKGAVSNA